MATVIDLKDLELDTLSDETMNLISRLTAEIRKVSGESFSFCDPLLLPRIRRRVKELKQPKLTALYCQYQNELVRSVNKGQFALRSAQMSAANKRSFYRPGSIFA
ncbi:MAG: hypothetical protein HKN50_04480 [Gammaproteobacteria bacterium]|nr:hypothetical protein [Gammaproteobacteria bacterium]